jgi:hypothetical protein
MIKYEGIKIGDNMKKIMKKNKKITITDGYNPELVVDAFFAGKLEFPIIEKCCVDTLPKTLLPISRIEKSENSNEEFIHFYENDSNFIDILNNIEINSVQLGKFAGIISSDSSVYWDSPLIVQLANIYRNHQTAYYLHKINKIVVPNIRWGDERTYTDCIISNEIPAFIGYPKHSVVAVGNYGCYQSKEEKYHFNNGLKAMIKELEPTLVIVYGSIKNEIFKELSTLTKFVEYNDWISTVKRRYFNGNK